MIGECVHLHIRQQTEVSILESMFGPTIDEDEDDTRWMSEEWIMSCLLQLWKY